MMEHSLIIALIILAGHSFTWDGQIFCGIRRFIKEDTNLSKPIYNCPICMTPWWGTLIWFIFFRTHYQVDLDNSFAYTTIEGWHEWFLTIGAATGLSVISVILIHVKDYVNKEKKL
jgi:hypothetical protein